MTKDKGSTDSIRVFFDSDVVISALLSKSGAAAILTKLDSIERIISSLSRLEIEGVSKRLDIPDRQVQSLIKTSFFETRLAQAAPGKFVHFAIDKNDAHIVAGAASSSVSFLVSYNTKDFRCDLIRSELGIVILKPGQLLQYLRCMGLFS